MKRLQRLLGTATAVSLAVALAVSMAVPAHAGAPEPDTYAALDSVSDGGAEGASSVFGNLAPVTTRENTDLAIEATVSGVEIGIPADPSDPVQIAGNGVASFAVSIPESEGAGRASALAPGAVEFESGDYSTAAVIRTDGSVQFLSVIDNAAAPTSYTYDFDLSDGWQLALGADGSVAIIDVAGIVNAIIAPAWAVDFDGRAIATRYSIDGDHLTQTVDHAGRGVVYPVVADPTVTWYWWGVALKATRAETKSIAAQTTVATTVSYLCVLIAGANVLVAAACGLAVLGVTYALMSWADGVYARGNCIQMNIPYVGPVLYYEVRC